MAIGDAAELLADLSIATEGAHAGREQIAHPRQAGEGRRIRPHGHAPQGGRLGHAHLTAGVIRDVREQRRPRDLQRSLLRQDTDVERRHRARRVSETDHHSQGRQTVQRPVKGVLADRIHHDRLISRLGQTVPDKRILRLIGMILRSGIMANGMVTPSTEGAVQGSPLSPLLSNIVLDELDKELERRGLPFCRFADDCNIFVRSEKAADRVMKSITSWLERKLRLKVNATKTKVVRPTKSTFLGFTFWKSKDGWKCRPAGDRKMRLYDKTREILCRKKAAARTIQSTFQQLNWLIRGWVNYYKIGSMKGFLDKYGQWLRHKVRVVILKQWKKPRRIYLNLQKLNRREKCNFSDEEILKVANSRLGWYRRCGMYVVNYALNPKILGTKTKDRPGLVDPLAYYLGSFDSTLM